MQTNSHHFTSRILPSGQRAHASFRKVAKQWNKGKKVNSRSSSAFSSGRGPTGILQ